jgi:type II secretory pathway pseudopilin PulG
VNKLKADLPTNPEGGFTLVETLIGLLILAVSSGLLLQSIASASNQMRSARNFLAAEQIAVSILAEHMKVSARDNSETGVDQTSGLVWSYEETSVPRSDANSELAGVKYIKIEVRLTKDAPAIYRVKTLAIQH